MSLPDDGKVPAQRGEDAPGAEVGVQLDAWFLSAGERGNRATLIDERRGTAWSTGNQVDVLVHGASYFAQLLAAIDSLGAGDTLLFTDWRGDPDERLEESGTTVAAALSAAAKRGAVVDGLVWRSHWDRLAFSAEENRRLGTDIEVAGGCCLLDMRVRLGGSHHQKFVVIRHGDVADERDVAFVGGIDLCHSRRDDATHAGDAQRQPMAAVYGDRPPWHDVQLKLHGPAVGDVEFVFRERWSDPQPLSRAPWRRIADRLHREAVRPRHLTAQIDDPPPAGPHAVQLLRTYADRRVGYPFAPTGERSIARGFLKALSRARSFVYIEDQYLWSRETASAFAVALRNNPTLRLVAVVPRFPDQDGRFSCPPNHIGRADAVRMLREAGGGRVTIYDVENADSVPIYVHAKVCVIDDVWACVGSANLNRRSWSHDSELSCAVIDETLDGREPIDPGGLGDGARTFARDLRLMLVREHLERGDSDNEGLVDPGEFVETLANAASRLERWHAGGRVGVRPQGRLRPHRAVHLDRTTQAWARPLYRLIYDPDGRPRRLRRSGRY